MKNFLFISALAIGLTGLSGCNTQTVKTDTAAKAETAVASADTSASASQQGYEAAMAAAKAEIKKAKAVAGEWRDTGKIMKKAEKAAAAGDFGKATKLANSAKYQAIKGQEQAASQVNAGNPAYLY